MRRRPATSATSPPNGLLLDTAVAPAIAEAAGERRSRLCAEAADDRVERSKPVRPAVDRRGRGPRRHRALRDRIGRLDQRLGPALPRLGGHLDAIRSQRNGAFDGDDFTLANPSPAQPVTLSGRAVLTPNAGNDLYRSVLRNTPRTIRPTREDAGARGRDRGTFRMRTMLSQRLERLRQLAARRCRSTPHRSCPAPPRSRARCCRRPRAPFPTPRQASSIRCRPGNSASRGCG